ncbi:MAG: phytoene/squalene synthase family protein [Candidatus Nanopelagicales bacterium]|nr:phytoene/squalene synthase family protein [Candidatus Nanopelagicales bacterium]MCF8539380.1 phytoene/squalene synthase family protein [Candidatus Nanopelagicales bacterium]MCF8551898.1 phytoene/squalene synthase family protein [Candidatus Nanopelagicales bacterium]
MSGQPTPRSVPAVSRVHRKEYEQAGITDPDLVASYEVCRELNAQHGKTYYLATLLLPPGKRPYVHALYGFARYADEIVDDLDSTLTDHEKAEWLRSWGERFMKDVRSGTSTDPVCRAVVHTVRRWDIPLEHFEAFLHSMTMDLTVTEYPTFDDLYEYVYGSAAVIGLQMVPILEPDCPEAYDRAKDLGVAFQLANFIRDVNEDLDRGRVYLPLDELARFGVTRSDLEKRQLTPEIKAALRHQIDRVRRLERESQPGIEMLHPSSRDCTEAARVLYCGIADQVEEIDFAVFTKRAKVPLRTRFWVAFPAWRRARKARKKYGPGKVQGLHPAV